MIDVLTDRKKSWLVGKAELQPARSAARVNVESFMLRNQGLGLMMGGRGDSLFHGEVLV